MDPSDGRAGAVAYSRIVSTLCPQPVIACGNRLLYESVCVTALVGAVMDWADADLPGA